MAPAPTLGPSPLGFPESFVWVKVASSKTSPSGLVVTVAGRSAKETRNSLAPAAISIFASIPTSSGLSGVADSWLELGPVNSFVAGGAVAPADAVYPLRYVSRDGVIDLLRAASCFQRVPAMPESMPGSRIAYLPELLTKTAWNRLAGSKPSPPTKALGT